MSVGAVKNVPIKQPTKELPLAIKKEVYSGIGPPNALVSTAAIIPKAVPIAKPYPLNLHQYHLITCGINIPAPIPIVIQPHISLIFLIVRLNNNASATMTKDATRP